MCYSNSLTSKNVDLKKKYKKEIPSEIAEESLFHVSGFSYPTWRIITSSPAIQMMQWGLIPSWYKGGNVKEMAALTLNARSETAHEKPAFRNAMERYHCIVPSTGFFEYQTRGKEKVPYFIYPSEGEILSMAGIYDIYQDPLSGETLNSFSILTCEANDMMAEIHNTKKRMPVVLKDEQLDLWLNTEDGFQTLLKPAENDFLMARRVNPKILKGPEQNSPKAWELHEPIDYQQGSLF